jgi:hypothetical protein
LCNAQPEWGCGIAGPSGGVGNNRRCHLAQAGHKHRAAWSLDQRTFVPAVHGFLDRIRRGHPDTPILVTSAILWPGNEDVPGPCDVEFLPDGSVRGFTVGDPADIARGALTLATSREHLEHIVRVRIQEGEPISYLDGHPLYGPADIAAFLLPDGLHPDRALYQEMGRRFARLVFDPAGLVPDVADPAQTAIPRPVAAAMSLTGTVHPEPIVASA